MEDLNEMQASAQQELQQAASENIENAGNDTQSITNATAEAPEAEAPTAEAPAEAKPSEETEPEMDCSQMTREELVDALNSLAGEEVQKIKNRVAAIRNQFNTLNADFEKKAIEAFLAEGGNKEDFRPDTVAESFRKAYGAYRARRQQYQEQQEETKKRNLAAKQELLEELRGLISKDEESIKLAMDQFNAIQEKWKSVGEVPRDQMNDLWQNYHFLIEQFFSKLKINRELRMLDLKRNLEKKIQLCEKAEELIMETSITKSFKALQDLRAQWREIGPVPTEQNEEIWQRFNTAANQIDSRRKEYYDQRREELNQNLLAKQALIEKATELSENQPQSAKGWNDMTAALDELLKLWKSIGPVPTEQNEEIWTKFKGIIDKHYADKKEHFSHLRDEQSENYNKKIDLCLKAESIAKREDWKKATEELLQLQAEWKTIGAVNHKQSEKLWQRFRSACDEFFAKKGEFFKDIRSSENENLAKKEAIIEQIRQHAFGDNKDENLAAIKDYQRQWTEIGHVPMKDKDRVQKEYRELVNGIFEKLKLSAREAEETAYRERVRNAGDTKRFVNNERNDLMERIEKMRNDLKLWENNLGFLANSKQAELLKQEFEKKMNGTRQQIALLQAKLRILNEAESNKEDENN